jgi:hypothetical protein
MIFCPSLSVPRWSTPTSLYPSSLRILCAFAFLPPHHFLSPFFSSRYRNPIFQPLCFHLLAAMGGYTPPHHSEKDKHMNTTITSTTPTPDLVATASEILGARCPFVYPNGKRCSSAGLPERDGYCRRHTQPKSAPSDFDDLSSDLLPQPSDFSDTGDIHVFLTRLLSQVTKGRISPRRAAVLAYITNQLLHSQRVIAQEIADQPQQIIFDLPRPKETDTAPWRTFLLPTMVQLAKQCHQVPAVGAGNRRYWLS